MRPIVLDMDSLEFKHFVITRFGLGQAKEDFYQLNIEYLENLLAVSLRNQTNRNFYWIVLIDVRAPKWVFTRLNYIIRGILDVEIVKHDPFKSLSIMPDISELISKRGVSLGEYIIVTRVDSDDALSVNYIDNVSVCLTERLSVHGRVPVSINPVNGVYYYPEQAKFFEVFKNNYSVQTIGGRFCREFVHPYSGSHKEFSIHFRRKGWQAVILNTPEPLWLRSMRKDSNVHESSLPPKIDCWFYLGARVKYAVLRALGRRGSFFIKSKGNAEKVLQCFSFNKYSQNRLLFVERSMCIKDDSPSSRESLRRWQYKQAILDLYISSFEDDSLADTESKKYRRDLISQFYAR